MNIKCKLTPTKNLKGVIKHASQMQVDRVEKSFFF